MVIRVPGEHSFTILIGPGKSTKKTKEDLEPKRKLSNMKLSSFVAIYFQDKEVELKKRTLRNKKYMIDTHVIPFLGDKKMNEITPADIIAWQKEIKEKNNFSESYLRMLQNQVTAIFIHESKIYALRENPCKRVEKMGRSDDRSLTFWTLEEYQKFIITFDKRSMHYVMFELLFWTGIREGELLALTKDDFDFGQMTVKITKTYFRINREDVITTPKTDNSIRTIDLPQFLVEEIKECQMIQVRKHLVSHKKRLLPHRQMEWECKINNKEIKHGNFRWKSVWKT